MKKLLTLLITSFLVLSFVSSNACADAAKGQKYYLKFFKKKTGVNGGEFAKQHTTAEWNALFANGGAAFKAEYSKKFPAMEEFLNGAKFGDKYMSHIKDFCINYSKDSGNVPSC